LNRGGPFCIIPALLWQYRIFGADFNENLQCQSA
jgi:hypothetical protein